VDEYHASAATFDPREWDARALARLARRCGMTYAVFTAKHHAGYAMFDTAYTHFGSMHSPCRRDFVADYVEAFRGEGLKVGLYLSLSDWHHPDYPAFRDEHRPYVLGVSPPAPEAAQWDRYHGVLMGQLRELLTNYGPIDVVWFDGGWERPAWRWRPDEVVALIRDLQPTALVNDRLPGGGDFTTPEQFVPPTPPDGAWETCMTMNDSWGYNPADTGYKPARALIHTLCEVAGRGGNLLLNVSPTGTGALPNEQLERLDAVARWMAAHGESVVGVGPGLEPWQFYGPSTRRDNRVYLHLLWKPYDVVTVRGLPVRRVTASVVGRGTPLEVRTRTTVIDSFMPDPMGEVTIVVPEEEVDQDATVIALDVSPRG
jgi:alpha-L-fucosidase